MYSSMLRKHLGTTHVRCCPESFVLATQHAVEFDCRVGEEYDRDARFEGGGGLFTSSQALFAVMYPQLFQDRNQAFSGHELKDPGFGEAPATEIFSEKGTWRLIPGQMFQRLLGVGHRGTTTGSSAFSRCRVFRDDSGQLCCPVWFRIRVANGFSDRSLHMLRMRRWDQVVSPLHRPAMGQGCRARSHSVRS